MELKKFCRNPLCPKCGGGYGSGRLIRPPQLWHRHFIAAENDIPEYMQMECVRCHYFMTMQCEYS